MISSFWIKRNLIGSRLTSVLGPTDYQAICRRRFKSSSASPLWLELMTSSSPTIEGCNPAPQLQQWDSWMNLPHQTQLQLQQALMIRQLLCRSSTRRSSLTQMTTCTTEPLSLASSSTSATTTAGTMEWSKSSWTRWSDAWLPLARTIISQCSGSSWRATGLLHQTQSWATTESSFTNSSSSYQRMYLDLQNDASKSIEHLRYMLKVK